eukprot:319673_1
MSLQAWMKKEGVFDRDICRELQSRFDVKDPEYDFSKISKSQWAKFKKQMIQQKKQEIKDNTSIRRLEQKLAKIGKKWKTQQGKKFKGTASISKKSNEIEKKSNLQPTKAKGKKKNKNKKGVKSKKDNKTLGDMDPHIIKLIIFNWCRTYKISMESLTYKNINFIQMVCKYCPIFGYGNDGILTIKSNKIHTLSSDELHEFESIILKKKATLTVNVWKTKAKLQEYNNLDGNGGILLLKVSGNIIMNEGSKITVKACGYPGGFGKGVKGGKGMGINDSGGEHGEWTSATGGLYKSKELGDEKMGNKLVLGSGGGGITSTANRFFPGGNGGGILKIECNKLIFKGNGCVLSASGATSIHGAGGSGGVLWLKCIGFNCNGNYLKQCKIINKGGKGDGDEYSEKKENAEDGVIRIDILNEGDCEKIKKIIKCSNVYYGYWKPIQMTVKKPKIKEKSGVHKAGPREIGRVENTDQWKPI